MTGTGRRPGAPGAAWVAPALVSLGLLVVLWAATAGPVDVIGPSTLRPRLRPPTPSPSASAGATPQPAPFRASLHPRSHGLAWVGDLVAWALFLALAAGLVLGLLWLWRHRWHRPPAPPGLDVDPLPDVRALTEALGRDATGRLESLRQGDPGEGIVRCWLRLEEVIADAGLPRDPAETSTEFTVRVLHALDLDPHAIGTLAALYREARFSRHRLDETARTTAAGMLELLHRDVAELAGGSLHARGRS